MAVVEREKLYEQVWTIPGARLAPLYGVSDVALAKVCKRYKIPRPPRGYWAKLAAGQQLRKPRLPELRDDRFSLVEMQGWDMPDEVYAVNVPISGSPGPPESNDAADSSTPHELVIVAQAQLAAAEPDRNGFVRTDPTFAPEVAIAPASVPRCLALLNSLLRKWEKRGGTVRVAAGVNDNWTALAIDVDEVFVRIYEEMDEDQPLTSPARLTGRLCAQLHGPNIGRQWADRKVQRLEKVLGTLIATAADTLERARAERLDKECVQRQVQRVEKLRTAAVRRFNTDFGRRQQLMEYAHRWRDAEIIRGYLSGLQTALEAGTVHPVDEESFRDWFNWALQYADSIDPVLQADLPGEDPPSPRNTPVAALDLTKQTRAIVAELGVSNTDDLARVTIDELREKLGYSVRAPWNEVTRVLEALGYDVAKREEPWY